MDLSILQKYNNYKKQLVFTENYIYMIENPEIEIPYKAIQAIYIDSRSYKVSRTDETKNKCVLKVILENKRYWLATNIEQYDKIKRKVAVTVSEMATKKDETVTMWDKIANIIYIIISVAVVIMVLLMVSGIIEDKYGLYLLTAGACFAIMFIMKNEISNRLYDKKIINKHN